MIKKILSESDIHKNFDQLSQDRQYKYIDIYEDLYHAPEEYIIGIDVASPGSRDMCAVTYWTWDADGKVIIKGVKYF
jgi:hypothetical protein